MGGNTGPKHGRMAWGEKKVQVTIVLTPTALNWIRGGEDGWEVVEKLSRGLYQLIKRPSPEHRKAILEEKMKELLDEMKALELEASNRPEEGL